MALARELAPSARTSLLSLADVAMTYGTSDAIEEQTRSSEELAPLRARMRRRWYGATNEDAGERATRAEDDDDENENARAKGEGKESMHGFASDDEFAKELRTMAETNDAPYEALATDEGDGFEGGGRGTGASEDERAMESMESSDEDEGDDEKFTMEIPSAPPAQDWTMSTKLPERALADDLCCVAWTVARERLDVLQPLFRTNGASIGRITLSHLRTVMRKLEPVRATNRALDRLEAMLSACGYVEDVSLSEFVHATHSGTFAATRLGTSAGASEAGVLCAYMAELIARTPASAQTALMLGTRRHKAWLELPRLLAKTLEPEQLCLLVCTLDLADGITSQGSFVDVSIYLQWLRSVSRTLRSSNPLPTLQNFTAKELEPERAEASRLTMEEKIAARERLVRLWEEREQRRRGLST